MVREGREKAFWTRVLEKRLPPLSLPPFLVGPVINMDVSMKEKFQSESRNRYNSSRAIAPLGSILTVACFLFSEKTLGTAR